MFRPIRGHEGPEGGVGYGSTLSLTSALDGGGWSTSRPGRFTPGKETRYPLYRGMGGYQVRPRISYPTFFTFSIPSVTIQLLQIEPTNAQDFITITILQHRSSYTRVFSNFTLFRIKSVYCIYTCCIEEF